MPIVFECGHPGLRTFDDGMAAKRDICSGGSAHLGPLRVNSATIGQVDPGRPDQVCIRTGYAQAGVEPVKLHSYPVSRRFAQVPDVSIERIGGAGLGDSARSRREKRGGRSIHIGRYINIRRFPEDAAEGARPTVTGSRPDKQVGQVLVLARAELRSLSPGSVDLSLKPAYLAWVA